jgi:hypothetical protein
MNKKRKRNLKGKESLDKKVGGGARKKAAKGEKKLSHRR